MSRQNRTGLREKLGENKICTPWVSPLQVNLSPRHLDLTKGIKQLYDGNCAPGKCRQEIISDTAAEGHMLDWTEFTKVRPLSRAFLANSEIPGCAFHENTCIQPLADTPS